MVDTRREQASRERPWRPPGSRPGGRASASPGPGVRVGVAAFALQWQDGGTEAKGRHDHGGKEAIFPYDLPDGLELVTERLGRTIGLSYDNAGNRLTRTDDGLPTQSFAYDANDRIATLNGQPYLYDSNGNLLNDGSQTYAWDLENRLLSVAATFGQLSMAYDGQGHRLQSNQNGAITRYLVDPNTAYYRVLEETDAAGGLNVAYVYGNSLLKQSRSTGASYYHADAIGSTRALTDATEALTDSYAYEAFGSLLAASASTPNSYRFAGEEAAASAALYNLRARWHNPATGRFLSRDPEGMNQQDPLAGMPYAYGRDWLGMYTDPGGRQSIGETSVGVAVVGILSAAVLNVGGEIGAVDDWFAVLYYEGSVVRHEAIVRNVPMIGLRGWYRSIEVWENSPQLAICGGPYEGEFPYSIVGAGEVPPRCPPPGTITPYGPTPFSPGTPLTARKARKLLRTFRPNAVPFDKATLNDSFTRGILECSNYSAIKQGEWASWLYPRLTFPRIGDRPSMSGYKSLSRYGITKLINK